MDVLHFCNTPAKSQKRIWDQLLSVVQYFSKEAEQRIFLTHEAMAEAPMNLQEFLVKAADPKSYIISAAEVLLDKGLECIIVTNGGPYNQDWASKCLLRYTFLDAKTFVPAP